MLSVQYNNNYPKFKAKVEPAPLKINVVTPTSLSSVSQPKDKLNVHQKLANMKRDEDNKQLDKLIYFAENAFHNCCRSHEDIYKIGFALANVFKEDGRELFLFFAEEYTSIDWETTGKTEYDNKYTYYLNNNKTTLNLGTIYWILKRHDEKLYKKISKEWN